MHFMFYVVKVVCLDVTDVFVVQTDEPKSRVYIHERAKILFMKQHPSSNPDEVKSQGMYDSAVAKEADLYWRGFMAGMGR